MDKIIIEGGHRLEGSVRVSGAKNAALPLFCSAILADGPCTFRNVPRLGDIATMKRLLGRMGAEIEGQSTATVSAGKLRDFEAPYDLVKTMRASVLVLGPLLGRFGRARVSLPGGCAIGARPIDQHLKGLEAMGAKISLDHGYVEARAKTLRGARILFDITTVTGTENLLMAAVLAKGETILENAAREPEVDELAEVLSKMGARIKGAGSSVITIHGVAKLSGVEHTIMADRIEAGTLMVAAALTRGNVLLRGCQGRHLDAVIAKLKAAGVDISTEGRSLRVRARGEFRPFDITTQPHPGFPTDMQAQCMVLATQAHGQSVITETIFENRFMHVPELERLGADIVVEGRTAVVRGPSTLAGTTVMATDLRASASLVLAALVAQGETEVLRVYHLDRGYDRLDQKLSALGARMKRERGSF